MITLKNNTNNIIVLMTQIFQPKGQNGDSFIILDNLIPQWSEDLTVIQNIINTNIILNLNGNDILDANLAINTFKGLLPIQTINTQYPFCEKKLNDGSNIFRRVRGISASVQNIPVNIDFIVPYNKCKITGLQIIGAHLGDKATFQVLDTNTGSISGVPNAVLNTFGQDVYIPANIGDFPSKYDADLIKNLTLRVIYDAVDELLPRSIYINFDLHEVV